MLSQETTFFVRRLEKNTYLYRTPDYKLFSLGKVEGAQVKEGYYNSMLSQFPREMQITQIPNELPGRPTKQTQLIESFTQLYIIATGKCNFACDYCAQHKSTFGNMPKDIMVNNIKSFLKASHDPQGIVFYGGEPLMNWGAIAESIELIRNQHPQTEITVFSNGSLVNEKIAKFLADHQVGVIVSMDGPPELHTSSRKYKGNGNGYKMVLNGFQMLKDSGCRIGISCVVGDHNFKEIDEVSHYLCSLGPVNIGMNILHSKERSGYEFSPQDGANAIIKAAAIAADYGIEIEQFARRLRSFVFETARYGDCPACGRRLVVTPDGRLGPCEGAFPFVNDWFFNKISDVEKFSDKLKDWPCSNQLCHNCEAIGLCGGGCVLDGYLEANCLTGLDKRTCALSKSIISFALNTLDDALEIYESSLQISIEKKAAIFSRFFTTASKPLQTSSKFGENMGRENKVN